MNQLRGADMPGQNPQANPAQNTATPPSPRGGGAGGGVSPQTSQPAGNPAPANNPPGANPPQNPQGASPNPLNPQAQRQAPAGVVYSASPQTIERYNAYVDSIFDGTHTPKPREEMRVLDSSDLLGMLGLGNKPVVLQGEKIVKGFNDHPNLTAEHWKKAPEWLDNPALIFDSVQVNGRLVFIAPEQINGQPVRLILDPVHRGGGSQYSLLVSMHDQSEGNYDVLGKDWLKEKKKTQVKTSGAESQRLRTILRYYDTKKSRLVLTARQRQLLTAVIESGARPEPHVYDTRFQRGTSNRGMPILNELNLKSYRDSGQTVTPKTSVDHSALLNPAESAESAESTTETQEPTETAPRDDSAANNNIRYSVPPALQTQLDKHDPARYGALANAFATYEAAGYEAARDSLIQWAEEHYAGQGLGAMRLVLDGYHHERQSGVAINIPPPATLNDAKAQALADFMAGIPARAQEAAAQKREMDARAAAGLPLLFSTTPDGTYYRRNNRAEPYNDDFVMMFADKTDRLEHYGKNLWQIPPDAGARVYAGSEEFRTAMREWLEKNETWFKEMGYAKRPGWIETLLDEANPDDIVDSAGFWDIADRSVMRYFDEEVMQPNGWDVVTTNDGAITFNPDIVERVEEPEDDFDEWLEAQYEAYKAAHPEQEEAEEEAEPEPLEEIPGRALKGDTVTHQVYDLDLDKTWSFTNGEDAAAFKQRKGEETGDAGRFMLQEVEPHVKEYDPLYSAPPVPSQLASERLATIRESGGRRAYDEAAKRGRTVLSYHDWLTVRSPSFKAWFGDWQAGESSRAVHPRTGEPLKVYLRRAAPGYMTFTDKANPRAAFAGFIRVDNDASGGVWAVFDRNQLMPAPEPVPPTPSAAQPAYSTAPQERVSRFAQAVDAIANGTPAASRYIRLGTTTPEALQLSGLPNVPIDIESAVIRKVMNENIDNGHGHNLTAEELKKLPRSLNRPIAVLRSNARSTNPDGYIVLTELVEEDILTGEKKPVVASLFLRDVRDGLQITRITSVYGKWKSQINNALQHDPIKYWDKEKGPQFLTSLRLQLPTRLRSDANLRRANIKRRPQSRRTARRRTAVLHRARSARRCLLRAAVGAARRTADTRRTAATHPRLVRRPRPARQMVRQPGRAGAHHESAPRQHARRSSAQQLQNLQRQSAARHRARTQAAV